VIVYGGRLSGSEPVLDDGILALPATEGTSGLGLNNSGDTITLRNADEHVIDRINFSKTSSKGSMTRDSGLNGAFTDHSTVADASVSAGVWPSGAPFTEDPTVEIPEIKITVNLADGEIHLRWRASPTANYTVRTSNSVAGAYTPAGNKLKFDDSMGSFSTKADRAAQFFTIHAK